MTSKANILPLDDQGRKHGKHLIFRKNGTTMFIRNYKHGQRHGLRVCLDNGNVVWKYFMRDNKRFGSGTKDTTRWIE